MKTYKIVFPENQSVTAANIFHDLGLDVILSYAEEQMFTLTVTVIAKATDEQILALAKHSFIKIKN